MPDPRIAQVGVVDADLGEGVTIIQPANVYGCTIGNDTFVGPFVEIQRGAVIGQRCRIQSHSFICEGVTIGDDCVIAHGVMFINDSFRTGGPARGDRSLWKATRVGDNVSIGSNATILPVTICAGAVIGAGAVVTRDLLEPAVYAGNPARKLRGFT